jgi:meiotically up-regulated gene 157 (Mug157) protein
MWGFCEKEDPVWRNTMEFSFTASNQGGYYEGAFAGLGSVHTPRPWPLGDAQEMLFRWLIQDEAGRDEVLSKLLRIVQWDGLFSEAVHQETGRVESRHWFSWPGAFISTVLLETARG